MGLAVEPRLKGPEAGGQLPMSVRPIRKSDIVVHSEDPAMATAGHFVRASFGLREVFDTKAPRPRPDPTVGL
jgi:hypothetical protein